MKAIKMKSTVKSIIAVTTLVASAAFLAGNNHYRGSYTQVGEDNNSAENAFIQPQDPALSGGGRDQTMQFGDIIIGKTLMIN